MDEVRNEPRADCTSEYSHGWETKTAPGLEPGATVDVVVPMPARNCFSPDCSISVEVGNNDNVQESNENNNQATAMCLG